MPHLMLICQLLICAQPSIKACYFENEIKRGEHGWSHADAQMSSLKANRGTPKHSLFSLPAHNTCTFQTGPASQPAPSITAPYISSIRTPVLYLSSLSRTVSVGLNLFFIILLVYHLGILAQYSSDDL